MSREVHQSTELAEIASGRSYFLHGVPPMISLLSKSPCSLFLIGSLVCTMVSTGIAGALYSFPITEETGGSKYRLDLVVSWIMGVIVSNMLLFLASWINEHLRIEFTEFEKLRERWEVDNYPEGEIQEMVCIYNNYGISDKDAEIVARTLSKYKDFWVDHMLLHEIGILPRIAAHNQSLIDRDDTDDDLGTASIIWKHCKPIAAYIGSFIPTTLLIIIAKSPFAGCGFAFCQLTFCLLMQRRTHEWISLSSSLYVLSTVAISAAVVLSCVQVVSTIAI